MQCICITLQVRMDLYFYCVAWGGKTPKFSGGKTPSVYGRENSIAISIDYLKCGMREGKLQKCSGGKTPSVYGRENSIAVIN